jgi:GNAT superfamily N-acetyltransferase
LEIVRAKPSDASTLSAIARVAKAHWGYPARWLDEWRELLTITPEFIAANETFAAVSEGRIVGFHALHEADGTLRLEHLWVLPEQMQKGIGRSLFQHAAGRAAALGAPSLTIEADPNAEPFYRHMGAERIGAVRSKVEGRPRELPLLRFALARSSPPSSERL